MKSVLESIHYAVTSEPPKASIKIKKSLNDLGVKTSDNEVIVFLSLSDNISQTYVIKGKDKNFEKAIISALETYFKNKPSNFKPVSTKLDLVAKISPVNRENSEFNFKENEISLNRGRDGLSFDLNFDMAFLPDEVVAYHLIKKKKFNDENISEALNNHLSSSGNEIFHPSNSTKLYTFRTKSFYIDNNSFHKLYRGHQIFSDLTKSDLWQAIQLTKNNYFQNVVDINGKFIYSYLPESDTIQKKYNILRHAGTTYSMLETYELMPDKSLLQSAERAISFLMKKLEVIQINGHQAQVVVEKDAYKIGGNALAIVALAKYTQLTGDKQYIPVMQSMATWMREVQNEDGQFGVHKQIYSTGEIVDFTSHFYPGEAILSLVRLYQIDHNEEWLDVAENVASYLIKVRDKSETVDTIAHDHWLLYALNDLYRERKKDLYLDHSLFIAQAIMKTQIRPEDASRKELVGGYVPKSGNEPKSTPVACRSEGLSATYKLALDSGYKKEAQKIKNAIHQGIKFQLQMQLRPESTMFYKKKHLCLGAVQAGLKKYELRNDYTQHNISSFIAYYNILGDSR